MSCRAWSGWTELAGGAFEQEVLGFKFRIELEGKGRRLFVGGEKRGFFDTLKSAQSHAFWLANHGNPKWERREVTHAPKQRSRRSSP